MATAVAPVPASRRSYKLLALAAAVTAAVAAVVWQLPRTAPTDVPPRLAMQQLTNSGNVQHAGLSPDGRFAVYVELQQTQNAVLVQQISTGSTVQIAAPQPLRYRGVTVSPDGSYVS